MSTVGSGAGFAELGAYIEMKGCFFVELVETIQQVQKNSVLFNKC